MLRGHRARRADPAASYTAQGSRVRVDDAEGVPPPELRVRVVPRGCLPRVARGRRPSQRRGPRGPHGHPGAPILHHLRPARPVLGRDLPPGQELPDRRAQTHVRRRQRARVRVPGLAVDVGGRAAQGWRCPREGIGALSRVRVRRRRRRLCRVRRQALRDASKLPGGEQGAAEEAEGGWRRDGGVRHVLHRPRGDGLHERVRRDQRWLGHDEPPGKKRGVLRVLRDCAVGAGALHPPEAAAEDPTRG
mmetsp:Transcript_11752/g.50659  ORF Transcript_11752/g.50659 Transcript_11752/m.50659 type:complete len:247 (+) Transcript_11752:132-872(+)